MKKNMNFHITRLSSKSQLVIPGQVRQILGLRPGTKLALFTDGEHILLKPISAPEISAFSKLAFKAQKIVKSANILI